MNNNKNRCFGIALFVSLTVFSFPVMSFANSEGVISACGNKNYYFNPESDCTLQCTFQIQSQTKNASSFMTIFGMHNFREAQPTVTGDAQPVYIDKVKGYKFTGGQTDHLHIVALGNDRGPSAVMLIVPCTDPSYAPIHYSCDVSQCPLE